MDEMVVSDLEYLEEQDVMNWSYLNIVIRKKLIIVLKYFKLKQHLVQDYTFMESEVKEQHSPHTTIAPTGFSDKARVKERVSEKLSPFNGNIADWIPWETHKNTVFGFNGWGLLANRPDPVTIKDSENTIKINENIFWSLQLALQDGDASQCIRQYAKSGPYGTSDGWQANQSLKLWMETSDNQKVMTLTLDKQLHKIVFYKGSIGTHINQWNKIMAYIVHKSPDYYTKWRKLHTLKTSIRCKSMENMQELQVINNWDLKTFQTKLRTLEVVHQDNFGFINFRKHSAKSKPRFQLTTRPIRRQTNAHIEENSQEYDSVSTQDSDLDTTTSRRQDNTKNGKPRTKYGAPKNGSPHTLDKNRAKHLLEDKLYKSLTPKEKKQYMKFLNAKDYERCTKLRNLFIK